MSKRHLTASEREATKRAGIEPEHPADRFDDPMAQKLADLPEKTAAKKPKLKHIGGSDADGFNVSIANSVFAASWITDAGEKGELVANVGQALAGIAPRDEVEGMLAAQMVAAHQASMECFKRAMIIDQSIQGRELNLKFATKASQTYAALLDALNRHRGKGPQRVIVEHRHLHFHENGKPPVDPLETGAAGGEIENHGEPHAPRLAHAPQVIAPVWSEDAEREAVPGTGDGEREVSNARRPQSRSAKG